MADEMGVVKAREKEVEGFLARNAHKDAIIASLKDPPIGSKSQEVKDANAAIVYRALGSAKEADYDAIVKAAIAANPDNADTLMKYVYRALAETLNCSIMLKWHAVVVQNTGLGPIVRSMTDRKTL